MEGKMFNSFAARIGYKIAPLAELKIVNTVRRVSITEQSNLFLI